MKARRSPFLLGALILLGCSSSYLLCAGQTPTASPAYPLSSPGVAAFRSLPRPANSQTYYIELTARRECKTGDCPLHISDKSFSVSQNGREYPVRVSQPLNTSGAATSTFPTHLLVVFSPGALRSKDSNLVKRLNKVLSQGWLVSVNRSDGSFTPYSTAATLAVAMATPDAPLSAEQAQVFLGGQR